MHVKNRINSVCFALKEFVRFELTNYFKQQRIWVRLNERNWLNFRWQNKHKLWYLTKESRGIAELNMANLVEILLLANCAVNIPLALTAIIGNALVLHAVWKTPSLRSPSILLLCGLASTDLAVGVVVQPLFITRVLVKIYAAHSVDINFLFFILYNVVVYTVCGVSFATIAIISLDRLIAILKPFQYASIVTIPRLRWMFVAIWLSFSLVGSMQIWAESVLFLVVGMVGACGLCISTLSHVMIYRIVRHHQNAIQVQLEAVQASTVNTPNIARLKKSALNTFIFYIVLILCYCPYLANIALGGGFLANCLTGTIVFINSSLNPILYCWRIREIWVVVSQNCRALVFWK